MDDREIVGLSIAAIITSFIGYLFHRKSKRDDLIDNLEERIRKLELGQKDVEIIKETQKEIAKDIKDMLLTLTNLRIDVANKIGDKHGEERDR